MASEHWCNICGHQFKVHGKPCGNRVGGTEDDCTCESFAQSSGMYARTTWWDHEAPTKGAVQASPGCKHWGHKPGEWFYACCSCSGIPDGCKSCSSDSDDEEEKTDD